MISKMNAKPIEKKRFMREYIMNRASGISKKSLTDLQTRDIVDEAEDMWRYFDEAIKEEVEEVKISI